MSPTAPARRFVAAAVGSVSYVAIFIFIACISRRTAVWSLAFVFLIERLLGTALTGIAQLSPTWESRAIFVGLLDFRVPDRLIREGIPQGVDAIVRLLGVAAVALALATWRMRHLRLSGASTELNIIRAAIVLTSFVAAYPGAVSLRFPGRIAPR